MTPDGSSFRLLSAEAADTMDVLSAVLRRATDLTLALRRDGTIQAAILNPQSDIASNLNHWIGHHINSVLTIESQEKLARVLEETSVLSQSGTLDTPPMELNHRDSTGLSLSLRYSFVKVSSDDTLLLLGQDLASVAESQQALVRAQQRLETEMRDQREKDALFSVLKNRSQNAVVFVNSATLRITDATLPAQRLLTNLGEAVNGKSMRSFAANEAEEERLATFLNSPNMEQNRIDVVLASGSTATITAEKVRTARDFVTVCHLNSDADTSSVSDVWAEMARTSPDALVLLASDGVMKTANPAFLDLCEKRSIADVTGASIIGHLGRGQVDWSVISDMTSEHNLLRHYQTTMRTDHGAKIPVSASAATLQINGDLMLALAFRDTPPEFSAEDAALRDAESVAELVGKASLKDIVSQTTEVIEKICIETAIKMTKNNRFAAAEMLNLSRQSLYVKLRKYGLIDKTDLD